MCPGAAQVMQAPLHAVLQQTPCTHIPLAHCEAPLHVAPFRWTEEDGPDEGGGLDDEGVLAPGGGLEDGGGLDEGGGLEGGGALDDGGGLVEGAGHAPAGAFVQMPMCPGAAQVMQAPLHAVLQQTPCTHIPLAHCEAPLHVEPIGAAGSTALE